MEEDKSIVDYGVFEADVTGQILRYKILVKDQKIHAVLYNQGVNQITEVPFIEHRLSIGDTFILDEGKVPIFVKIEHLPICMMASLNKEKLSGLVQGTVKNQEYMNGFCKERYFERLPGFIDI